jgi:hypothetical protein
MVKGRTTMARKAEAKLKEATISTSAPVASGLA